MRTTQFTPVAAVGRMAELDKKVRLRPALPGATVPRLLARDMREDPVHLGNDLQSAGQPLPSPDKPGRGCESESGKSP